MIGLKPMLGIKRDTHFRRPAVVLVTVATDNTINMSVTIASGMVKIYWGDGDSNEYGPGAQTPSHTYSDGEPSHTIVMVGALDQITLLHAYSCNLTTVSGLTLLTSLTVLHLYSNQLTDIGDLSGLTSLTDLRLGSNQLTDIGDLSGLTSLTVLYLYSNQLTDIGDLSGLTSLTDLQLENNGLSEALVDGYLDDIASTIGSRPTSATFYIHGTNSAPSIPDGCDDYDTIVAHGWTVLITGSCP